MPTMVSDNGGVICGYVHAKRLLERAGLGTAKGWFLWRAINVGLAAICVLDSLRTSLFEAKG